MGRETQHLFAECMDEYPFPCPLASVPLLPQCLLYFLLKFQALPGLVPGLGLTGALVQSLAMQLSISVTLARLFHLSKLSFCLKTENSEVQLTGCWDRRSELLNMETKVSSRHAGDGHNLASHQAIRFHPSMPLPIQLLPGLPRHVK